MRARSNGSERVAVRILLAAASAAALASCGGDATPAAPSQPSRDFRAEAQKSIDDKNMNAELERLKGEVEADSK